MNKLKKGGMAESRNTAKIILLMALCINNELCERSCGLLKFESKLNSPNIRILSYSFLGYLC